ncbi:MAG: RpiB/LacA/LacB family sugar-phosphate isomerase [Planctomycetota bacterium]
MNVALGADHRGSATILRLAERLRNAGHTVTLDGSTDGSTCDYPEAAAAVAKRVASGEAERGVLVCGTGIGMSIAANKVPSVLAAVVHNELTSQLARSHNEANVVCVSADLLGMQLIERIVDTFLSTEPEGGRHSRRVDRIRALECQASPQPEG